MRCPVLVECRASTDERGRYDSECGPVRGAIVFSSATEISAIESKGEPPVKTECPALLLTAPASGHGKTSITAALARLHRRNGARVRCFKFGPDFIDPTILLQASGQPVYNLDTWMMGVEHCRALLFEAAQDSDLILVEGAMGLFDGEPCSADLAQLFGLPILPVINAASMAQTFGALLHGLTTYRDELRFAGVVANRIASPRHEQMVRQGIRSELPVSIVARSETALVPERHLGLHLAAEIGDLDARLDALADLLESTPLAQLPSPVTFTAGACAELEPLLDGMTIAVACDDAFCFLYLANLEWLQRMGARLQLFSPLDDETLPEADAIYLPGGYPELHAARLAANGGLRDAIVAHVDAGRPLLAECGGMLYLADALVDLDGDEYEMLGLLPGTVTMGKKLAAIGPQQVDIDGAPLRGHTYHYSSFSSALEPAWRARRPDDRAGEALFRVDAITASYVHWYFPSNPALIARWLRGD